MKELREELLILKELHQLKGLKTGTEVEGMTFDEIEVLREVSRNIVPLIVKIGGPEARNDMLEMARIGVDKILAPMVESPYALKNFVKTILELNLYPALSLAVNIETITAYYNLPAIFQSQAFTYIDSVTVGRSDLSGSIEMDVDDEKVYHITTNIINQAKSYYKGTSVGGKVTPENAPEVRSRINPENINTRHMVFLCNHDQISENIKLGLRWEKRLYEYLYQRFPERKAFYDVRIQSLQNRMNKELAV